MPVSCPSVVCHNWRNGWILRKSIPMNFTHVASTLLLFIIQNRTISCLAWTLTCVSARGSQTSRLLNHLGNPHDDDIAQTDKRQIQLPHSGHWLPDSSDLTGAVDKGRGLVLTERTAFHNYLPIDNRANASEVLRCVYIS